MAKEKGYYSDAGLEVEIKPYSYGLNIANEVIHKKSTYGIGGSSLIIDASNGKPIKLLASILQSSPLIFLTTKESNISTIKDLKGKKIMTVPGTDVAVALYAMMNREGIQAKDLIYLKDSFDVNDLINKKTDIMMAYESNEPFLLRERGVKYTIFDPKKYGFDFYNDILFTSYDEAEKHHARALEFTNASLRGWEYAFSHIDEAVDVIIREYNTQNKSREALIFEANALKELAYSGTKNIGDIETEKLQRIYDIYNVSGFIKTPLNLKHMLFKESTILVLNGGEHAYLEQKKELKLCIQPDLFPIDGTKDGIHTGIVADIYSIIAKKLGITFIPIISKNDDDFLKNIKEKRCDLVSVTSTKEKMFPNVKLSQPLISTYLALISNNNQPFIGDISILERKKILVRHLQFKKILLRYNPRLTIEVCSDLNKITKKILNGEAYCIATPYETAEWMIQNYGIGKLKVNGFVGKDNPISGSIGVVRNDPLLLNILNKTLQSIPKEKVQEIKESWTLKSYSSPANYTPAWWMIAFFVTIFIAFLYRQRVLKQANSKLEDSISKRTSELQESKKLLENIFNATKESIGIVDKNTMFIFTNKAYFEMTGYSESELYKQSCLELTLEEDREVALYALNIASKDGYIDNIEIRCVKKDGTIIETRISIIALPDTDNFLLIANDISEENRLKKERLVQDQQMLQQSRLAQMGEMISMIAHQWRQPLGSIASTALNMKLKLELESFDLNTQEGREGLKHFFMDKLDNIEDYVENLTMTIDDFRNFYKPDKKVVMSSFKEVVHKALKIIRTSIEVDNIEIIEEYEDETQFAIYDSEMMQVALNILKNAQDNFKEKNTSFPQIKITSKSNILIISDNGGGIPDQILDKIFDPYFSTKSEKNGTGLGLYMSKQIIEGHHKGKLNVKNKNDGVSFKITLKGNND